MAASVDVVMGTYNHAPFVAQAIESVLMQECDYDVRLSIADDCSTDGTQDVLREYQRRYPDRITLALDSVNRGLFNKDRLFLRLLRETRADYIALLDTDDYWADPHKLQKQVVFLESNRDYVICYHNARIVDEEGRPLQASKLSEELKRDFSGDELIHGKMILTLTMCFRNVLSDFPEEFYRVYNPDKFLTSLLGNHGKGKYMAGIGDAVYRMHSAAVWSTLEKGVQVFRNGVTRAWLHRYYKRIGNRQYADFFRDETVRHFRDVLVEAAAAGGVDYTQIVHEMFTAYKDIIGDAEERRLRAIVKDTAYAQEGVDGKSGREFSPASRHAGNREPDRKIRGEVDMSLVSRLEERGWQRKKQRYEACFESAVALNHVDSPAISIIVISWRLHPDNVTNFQVLQRQREQGFELIFVDNGAKEGEFDALKPYIDTYVRLNTNTGAYLARNIGALFAKAPTLLFLEDDGIPQDDFVARHLAVHDKYDVVAVRGVYSPKTDSSLNAMATHYYLGDLPFPYPGNLEGNSSYRADAFFAVGGWDDDINFGYGGWELALRLLAVEPDPRKQIYAPDPVIYHDFAMSAEHLQTKREKQEASLQRLKKKYPHWDSVMNGWLQFAGRYDLIIPRSQQEVVSRQARKKESGSEVLSRVLWLYEGGDVGMAENLLGDYAQQLGEARV